MWDTVKSLAVKWGTPLVAKYALRAVTYGFAAISAKLAIDAPNPESQQAIAGWLAAAVSALLAIGIDYLQHRNDTK